jgi:hypothetical protein
MDRWELHAELAVGGEVPEPTIVAVVDTLKSLGAAYYAEGILVIRIDIQASSAEEARARAVGRVYEVLERTVAWTHLRWRRSEIRPAEPSTSPPTSEPPI